MPEEDGGEAFRRLVRGYAEILNPLFDTTPHMAVDRLFEFVCVLTRAGGMHDADWDPWYESRATLDDLGKLTALELLDPPFHNPARTRVRLTLLSYCHLTEMDFPYWLIANLLRLRLGDKYDMAPFRDLYTRPRRSTTPIMKMRPPSPAKKMGRIKKLAQDAQLASVADALDSIYEPEIRNAVYHSDYTLSEGELRLLSHSRLSKQAGCFTPVVEWRELSDIFARMFAFHSALFSLYERSMNSFGSFKDKIVPYDLHYKGLLQLLFSDARLIGFRVYWPNGTTGEYRREGSASSGHNLTFDPEGSINFMVGLYAGRPSVFSPLVEEGTRPKYSRIPETDIIP